MLRVAPEDETPLDCLLPLAVFTIASSFLTPPFCLTPLTRPRTMSGHGSWSKKGKNKPSTFLALSCNYQDRRRRATLAGVTALMLAPPALFRMLGGEKEHRTPMTWLRGDDFGCSTSHRFYTSMCRLMLSHRIASNVVSGARSLPSEGYIADTFSLFSWEQGGRPFSRNRRKAVSTSDVVY